MAVCNQSSDDRLDWMTSSRTVGMKATVKLLNGIDKIVTPNTSRSKPYSMCDWICKGGLVHAHKEDCNSKEMIGQKSKNAVI